jgi:hypothetical protein
MVITAKFDSSCNRCGKQIHAGDRVDWDRLRKLVAHEFCSETERKNGIRSTWEQGKEHHPIDIIKFSYNELVPEKRRDTFPENWVIDAIKSYDVGSLSGARPNFVQAKYTDDGEYILVGICAPELVPGAREKIVERVKKFFTGHGGRNEH